MDLNVQMEPLVRWSHTLPEEKPSTRQYAKTTPRLVFAPKLTVTSMLNVMRNVPQTGTVLENKSAAIMDVENLACKLLKTLE